MVKYGVLELIENTFIKSISWFDFKLMAITS